MVQIKIYHNRKGLRGRGGQGESERRRRRAQRYLRFLICKAVIPLLLRRPPHRVFLPSARASGYE